MSRVSLYIKTVNMAIAALFLFSATLTAQNPNPPEPCIPDCSTDVWTPGYPMVISVVDCGDWMLGFCAVKVYWQWRIACGMYRDLQITDIEFLDADCFTVRCTSPFDTPERWLNYITELFMQTNPMGWPPHNLDECEPYWRVSAGSCWKYNDASATEGANPYFEPCDASDCCLTLYEVCLRGPGGPCCEGHGVWTANHLEATQVSTSVPNCDPGCIPFCRDDSRKESFSLPGSSFLPSRSELHQVIPQPSPVNASTFTIAYSVENEGQVTLEISDMTARPVASIALSEASGSHSVQVDVGDLANGSYIFNLVQDGYRVGYGQIVIAR